MPENALVKTYIGLGSNMAQPAVQLARALSALDKLPSSYLLNTSSFYLSKPMGPEDQPDYMNAVAELDTCLAPLELLHALQKIELQQGRERKGQRWGPRTLDLDLLLYGQQQIQLSELQVPHYGMKERAFVLLPLAEIAPQIMLPCGTRLADLVNSCDASELEKLVLNAGSYTQSVAKSV